MLQNIHELIGNKLSATDGDIGHVKDYYFDDKTWAVRYLVVDTGSWLAGRLVLVSPFAFGRWDRDKHLLTVNLTRKLIEHCPPIASHPPVSRQYEEAYYSYYGWPTYWSGGGMWGMGAYPIATLPSMPRDPLHPSPDPAEDRHLRSGTAVTGYEIQATDGAIGSVRSFMVDDKSWAIGELLVETGHWYSGKEILISPSDVERISYEDSKVFVRLTKGNIQHTADEDIATALA